MIVKVCISTHHLVGGGLKTMVIIAGRDLAKQEYDVTCIFPPRTLRQILTLKRVQQSMVDGIKGFQVFSIPYLYVFNYLVPSFVIRRELNRYDIYQAIGGANLCALPFVINKKPFVCWVATTIRDEDEFGFNPFKSFELSMRTLLYFVNYALTPLALWIEKKIYEKADKIFALSKYTAQSIQRQCGIPKDKISVLYFPIDTNEFKPNRNNKPVMKNDFLLMVGRVDDPRKNIKLLIESFVEVKKRFQDLELVIIGDKPQKSHLEEFCVKLRIENSVYFLGLMARKEIIKYYNEAKLFVLPSFQEGLGIVVLESMACGTPVVSTKCGGPEEIIIHGENGYLVENNNRDELTNAICELLDNDDLREKMGKKAREHIQNNYSQQSISCKFIEAYKEVYPRLFKENSTSRRGKI